MTPRGPQDFAPDPPGGTPRPETSDRDIYATAKLVIARHGKSATYYANGRAEELADQGAHTGAETWRRIAAATEFLLAEERPGEAEIQ